jgi:hypothetical protein
MSPVSSAEWRRYALTPDKLRRLRLFCWCFLAAGLSMIPYGALSLRLGRLTLQWPTVPGNMMQADVWTHTRRNSPYYYSLVATYTYRVNGIRYASHQVRLWDNDLDKFGDNARAFARVHPARSEIAVYYDPQNPANAVLIPGANETLDHLFLWAGAAVTVLTLFELLRIQKRLACLPADSTQPAAPAAKIRIAAAKAAKSKLSPFPFLSYEPRSKCRLSCFPDKDCLLEVLGHGGKKLQDWTPDDRVIDSGGQVFRLAPDATRKQYELEPAGESWTWQNILDLAAHDAAVANKDPKALRQKVETAPEADRIRVIMQCVDELPSAPAWFWPGFILFLIVFALVVMCLGGLAMYWLLKWIG